MIHNIKLRARATPVKLNELQGEEVLYIGPPDSPVSADDTGIVIVCGSGKYANLIEDDGMVHCVHPSMSAALDLLLSPDILQSIGLITPRMANNLQSEVNKQMAQWRALRIENLKSELARLEALK